MPAALPIIGGISAVVGIAQGIQGLSAAAADKKDVKIKNEAAAIANVKLGRINESLRDSTREITKTLQTSVRQQNKTINQANKETGKLNQDSRDALTRANDAIGDINDANTLKVVNEAEVERINAARSRRQAIREQIIRRSTVVAEAGRSGVEGSALGGGVSSLSSQLGETLGNQSQVTAINRDTSFLDLVASVAQGRALDEQSKAQISQIEAQEVQRRAEADLRVQQNNQNLDITRTQNRISLQQNRADRIREQASLDPRKFINDNKGDAKLAKEARQRAEQRIRTADTNAKTSIIDQAIQEDRAKRTTLTRADTI